MVRSRWSYVRLSLSLERPLIWNSNAEDLLKAVETSQTLSTMIRWKRRGGIKKQSLELKYRVKRSGSTTCTRLAPSSIWVAFFVSLFVAWGCFTLWCWRIEGINNVVYERFRKKGTVMISANLEKVCFLSSGYLCLESSFLIVCKRSLRHLEVMVTKP